MNQNNSNFVTDQRPPGIYSIKDVSEVVDTMGDHKGTLRIEYDISMETKLILSPFVKLRLLKKPFLKTLLGFTAFWDYKPKTIHVESPAVYTSEKFLHLSTIDKIQLKCDVFHGFLLDGSRQPILFSFCRWNT